MPDPNPNPTPSVDPDPNPPAGDPPASPAPEDAAGLKKALEAQKEANARLSKKLEAVMAKQTKAEQDAAIARGEAEKLIPTLTQERDQYKARVEAFEASQEAEYADLVKDMSKDDKALIPESLAISEKLAFAKRLKARLAAAAPGGPRGNAPGNRGAGPPKPVNQMTPLELSEYKASLRKGAS